MNVTYKIGRRGSLTGSPYYELRWSYRDDDFEGLHEALVEIPSRQPTIIVVRPDDSTYGLYKEYHELTHNLKTWFNCKVVLQTIDRPNRVWNLFDYVILSLSMGEYVGEPANEVWLSVGDLAHKIDVPARAPAQIWVTFPLDVGSADKLAWVMRQDVPVHVHEQVPSASV